MKKLIYTLLFVPISIAANGQQAKYIFHLIGDGMGTNQVNGTETYRAELQNGRIGVEPLLFTQFSVATMATTFPATSSVTDFAAAGTTLATGKKTYNSTISIGEDKNPIETVAEKAKKAGKKVGVTTSVSVDRATPAAFYVHQADHNMNYEIVVDLAKANFDFYADGGFLEPDKAYDKKNAPNIFPIFGETGYTVARGYSDYRIESKDAGKMILIQEEGKDLFCLPYTIDCRNDDLTLTQITESAIDFLTKGKDKGFFLVVEGGKIDWVCHGNDAATVFNEVEDMDDVTKVAYEFYKKRPKEALIAVMVNHKTDGIVLGTGKYALNLKVLQYQKHSVDGLSGRIGEPRKSKGNRVTWEDVKEFLGREVGFRKRFPISWEQEKKLRGELEQSFVRSGVVFTENVYFKNELVAARAEEVMDQISIVGWVSGGRPAGYMPVFAIDAGSQPFGGKIDNTKISKRIAKATGYK